ncbi:FMN-binding glutamate synthase family protein [Tenacibaculum todarodis]|uniref:FMN-binding glutamate synthase family protein n=1 Tax=Tenacibaculum todarodis TaxID=1850252 RepID=A0A1L3JFN6_9FLAO|nr:FMN-binding glutamate synthase family protein [Tenacibaculum todarodis]APG63946.1 FMN-binding glutamate synthase family protein [Tenacibaculum todarodis]
MRNTILAILITATVACGVLVYFLPHVGNIILLSITGILTIVALFDAFQDKHSLLRSFPLIARLRWLFEDEREKIQQYFIEDNLNGTPINREKRSIVYQRAKLQKDTVPFGTQHNVYAKGYEFVKHSLFPTDHHKVTGERVLIGSDKCSQKYDASIINISAMSFGSLSKNAIKALNQGAKMANFAHNTGEGGISPYHLQGGDLIFQVGTGYFGAGKHDINGKRLFDDEAFRKNAIRPEVKMIEIKFSQGAKPGHGGILPAKKNTEEIAGIRGVVPFTQVDSPPGHSAFSNFDEMIVFLQKVRDLSGGKPIGVKFCVGNNEEIEEMIKSFSEANNYPDFISVDGGEGGTGSAPLEFSNYVGTPLLDGLSFVDKTLKKYKLRNEIKIIASGKAIDAFDIVKYFALGADAIGMARSFMLSLGCIQARECNLDTCPVGVATQDDDLVKALVVGDKNVRVKNYHEKTILATKELVAAMGKNSIADVKATEVFRRSVDNGKIETLEEVYS